MEYKIVWSQDTDRLAERVNRKIECGWKPQGGVSSAVDSGVLIFMQAMIREKNNNEKDN